jgi:hypothetical protein
VDALTCKGLSKSVRLLADSVRGIVDGNYGKAATRWLGGGEGQT